jgi:hypothetical protein
MQNTATISPLSLVAGSSQAPVKPLLSPEEEKLIALIANIAVDHTLRKAYEESNSLSPLQ